MANYPYFWLLIIAGPLAALVPDFFIKLFKNVFYPSPVDIVLTYQKEDPDFNFNTYLRKKEKKEESAKKRR